MSHTQTLKLIILITMIALLYIVNRWILGSKDKDKHKDDPLYDLYENGSDESNKQ